MTWVGGVTIRAMREVAAPRRYPIWQRRITALLLVLQTMVGTAVAFAHAVEPNAGPVTLESHHTAHCVMLHDTARCAQCQFDATRILSPITRRAPLPRVAARRLGRRPAMRRMPVRWRRSTAHPRAPPLPLS